MTSDNMAAGTNPAANAPVPALTVLVQKLDVMPQLTALCAGFEEGEWRAEQLAGSMMDWLPNFALNFSERQRFDDRTGRRMMVKAAQKVYETEKFHNRGEFGELLLHAVVSEQFDTEPAVSKIFYKDSANDTVKGFDCVHVVIAESALELWLGEAKFYANIDGAIRDVVEELRLHATRDYLRSEFIAIMDKIDPAWPHCNSLKQLLDPNTSLDHVFTRVRVPVLLTYDSDAVGTHTSWADPYRDRFRDEVLAAYETFSSKELPENLLIHLLLVPLKSKKELVEVLDQKLRAWKNI